MRAMTAITPEVYRSIGLRDDEYRRILDLMGREPTLTELGMFSVMWSEHCSYKHSKTALSRFGEYKKALEGEGHENAGLVPIGDGLAAVFKIESHNHPSAVEPYQGAATGVGGIIRDILAMGARPIACLNSLRFGPLTDARTRELLKGVVAGIGGYGNCVGVPTVGGEVAFHQGYLGCPLVNAMCVGIVREDSVASAGGSSIGNAVMYLGSATGRDGIHGATFASEALDEEGEDKRPNVQIGDPFAEKALIEATLEALATGAIEAIQDMGAAGLTCSTIEMASKGPVGMDVDLDKVPMRSADMSGYELMLSESQERMLAVVPPHRTGEVEAIFAKWGLPHAVIGTVTDGPLRISRHGEVEAEVNARWLTDECPVRTLAPKPSRWHVAAKQFNPDSVPQADVHDSLLSLLGSPSLASKEWVWRQYDHQVQTQTVVLPGQADAAVLAPRGTEKAIAVAVDGSSRWVRQDPYAGGQLAVAEACRNVACTGALPVALTDGLNFGNPETPEASFEFDEAVRGIADAAVALSTPVVSGNVSFYNENAAGEPIPPTPMIGAVGVLEKPEDALTMAFPDEECEVAIVDCADKAPTLGASSYLAVVHGTEDGLPLQPDLAGERRLHKWLSSRAPGLLCAHDVSEGGTLLALSEMCLAGSVGAEVKITSDGRADAELFGELPGRVLIAYREAEKPAIADGLRLEVIGRVRPESGRLALTIGQESIDWTLDEMREAYTGGIPKALEE